MVALGEASPPSSCVLDLNSGGKCKGRTCLSVGRDDSPGQSWHSCDSKAPKIFYDTVKNLSIVLCIVSVAAFNKCYL